MRIDVGLIAVVVYEQIPILRCMLLITTASREEGTCGRPAENNINEIINTFYINVPLMIKIVPMIINQLICVVQLCNAEEPRFIYEKLGQRQILNGKLALTS